MESQRWLTLQCPYCSNICGDICLSTCNSITWRCENCDEEFNVDFSAEEQVGYANEIARDSKALEDLVASFQTPFTPAPVISQLAIAIEETLVVYHEPHFIRWACRALQGIVNKNFNPVEYMSDDVVRNWMEMAASYCVAATRRPTPDGLIEGAAIAIEAALKAQDVMARNSDKVDCADVQKEK